jgi:acyl-CoA synthetase (AMP-forming)/AMP-acid ligase II/thioesterase domain-containing protein
MLNATSADASSTAGRDAPPAVPARVSDLLLGAAHSHPKQFVRYADRGHDVDQPYPELLDRARRLLTGLRGRNLKPDDKVLLLLERPQAVIELFWACLLGGFVPCVLAPPGGDRRWWRAHLTHVHNVLEKPLLVTTDVMRAALPEVPGLVTASVDDLAAAEPSFVVHSAATSDVALLVLTSGSTGAAKAVMLTHANLLASMSAKNGHLELTASDVSLNWIAFDHVAALLECHLLPMSVGASQVQVMPSTVLEDPLRFLRLISRHRVTVTFTPNFLLGLLNTALEAKSSGEGMDLSALRHILSGGEAVVSATATRLLDNLQRYGLDRSVLRPAFGMTETCAGCTYSVDFPYRAADEKFANLGTPVHGLRIRITDERDRPLPPGQVGEVQLTGPMVTAGYYRNTAATDAAFSDDGWFRSGDLGRVDGGRLTLVGRSKDSVIVNGVNYYSHDLETALGRLDGVRPGLVAAVPIRPAGGDTEQLAVFFATDLDDHGETALHRLMIAVRNGAILHWGFRPSVVLPVPAADIPKTSLGKIQRSQLSQRLENGDFAARKSFVDGLIQRQFGGFTKPLGETEIILAEIYGDLFGLPSDEVSATAGLFDIGGTSLDIIRLKVALQARLGIPDLPVTWIFSEPTVRGLAGLIDSGGQTSDPGYDPLVTLQRTGAKTPVFCVHPGTGEVMLYVSLAKYFTHERPFHALRARGFGPGETLFTDFDEMVECYARSIQEKQPRGPYAIAGYSYGGVVAFEIAKRLEAQGERVDFVGVISQIPHIRKLMQDPNWFNYTTSLAAYLGLITEEQKLELRELLADRPRQEQVSHLVSIASASRLAELDLDAEGFARWAALTYRLVELERDYQPSGSVRSLSVFFEVVPEDAANAEEQPWTSEEVRAWDEFSREPTRYVQVTGEHDVLLGPSYIEGFQRVMRAELDRALADT